MNKNLEKGFIALISTIIISVVLLFAVFAVGQRGIYSRFYLLDIERKVQSEKLASACIEMIRVAVVNDPTYSVTDLYVPIEDPFGCEIKSVSFSGGESTVTVHATSTGATTNLEAVIDNDDGSIISWKEFPGP